LVFPSFVSNTADLIAAGVYPIAQMRDFWPVMDLICHRIPRSILNAHYGIAIPIPTQQELRERGGIVIGNEFKVQPLPPPTVDELLTTYCVARGLLASFSGVPDYQRAARIIIKDYADGKLLYCHPPPSIVHCTSDIEQFYSDTVQTALRQTQRTRERLLKQQQKLEKINGGAVLSPKAVSKNGPGIVASNQNSQMNTKVSRAEEIVDDELIQMIAATTTSGTDGSDYILGNSSSANGMDDNTNKRHYKKKAGSKWGKKDRKNRNKDPYGCHSTPDNSLLHDVAVSVGK
jgi:hypothetical protein